MKQEERYKEIIEDAISSKRLTNIDSNWVQQFLRGTFEACRNKESDDPERLNLEINGIVYNSELIEALMLIGLNEEQVEQLQLEGVEKKIMSLRAKPKEIINYAIDKNIIHRTIDSNFLEYYFGKMSEMLLDLKPLDILARSLLDNGFRGVDCSQLEFDLDKSDFEALNFNKKTNFNDTTKEKFGINQILQERKKDTNLLDRKIVEYAIRHGIIPEKIDSDFINRYYGDIPNLLLAARECDLIASSLIMIGFSGIDCSKLDFSSLIMEEFNKLTFDSNTIFDVSKLGNNRPEDILKKTPRTALGLQNNPLTGKNVHVAIFDMTCDMRNLGEDINLSSYYRKRDRWF